MAFSTLRASYTLLCTFLKSTLYIYGQKECLAYIRELFVQFKYLYGDLCAGCHGSLPNLLKNRSAQKYEFFVLLLLFPTVGNRK